MQELLTEHAQEPRIPWVEIREEGVISPGGILESAGAQRIDYREEERAGCLVKIAQALRRLHDLTNVTMIRAARSFQNREHLGLDFRARQEWARCLTGLPRRTENRPGHDETGQPNHDLAKPSLQWNRPRHCLLLHQRSVNGGRSRHSSGYEKR